MKHRVREAAFNLIGPAVRGKHAIDLFAGSGALGLEALSRGAASATLIELHLAAARTIRENIGTLGVEDRAELVVASAFAWFDRGPDLPATAWLVFCAPPYAFYVDRHDQMIALVAHLIDAAPPASLLVVEADRRFSCPDLPQPDAWDVRTYAATTLGVFQTPS